MEKDNIIAHHTPAATEAISAYWQKDTDFGDKLGFTLVMGPIMALGSLAAKASSLFEQTLPNGQN